MMDMGTLFAAAHLRECLPCTGERGGGVARCRYLVPQDRLGLLLGVQGESFVLRSYGWALSTFLAACVLGSP